MLIFGYLNTFPNTFLEMVFGILNTKYLKCHYEIKARQLH